MESNDELQEIDIKNCTWCYFNGIMRIGNLHFDNISLNEKLWENSHENILIYGISYTAFMGKKPLRIRFDKIDVFIKIYYGTRYLILFGPNLW